jgi:hypothetical protein
VERELEGCPFPDKRWRIETFHKVLKSGCKAEETHLQKAARLTNLIAVFCIISWRVFWLTMVHRTNTSMPANKVFTSTEIKILDHISADPPPRDKTISRYLAIVAKLGGYLAHKNDGPPGNMVLWRGLARLTDVHLGYNVSRNLREKLVGH